MINPFKHNLNSCMVNHLNMINEIIKKLLTKPEYST